MRNVVRVSAPAARCCLMAVLLLLTGCGLYDGLQGTPQDDRDVGSDAGVPDAGESEENACGGTEQLRLDGEALEPGDDCGPCEDGTVVCDGVEALRCIAATAANRCGGCEPLAGEPDAECGPCGQGVWECDGAGGVECVGKGEINACGGCVPLDDEPNHICVDGQGREGVWGCTGPDDVRCVLPQENVCGGYEDLPAEPGTTGCGKCQEGVWQCAEEDENNVECADEQAGVNVCGGCEPLFGVLGDECGRCEGQWVCDGDNDVTCEGPELNLCGGCEPLEEGQPGQLCDDNVVWVCETPDRLSCPEPEQSEDPEEEPEPVNACGGTEPLDSGPGDTCGPCDDGVVVCASSEATTCSGESDPNVCGGCQDLSSQPGVVCDEGHVWACDGQDDLSCVPDEEAVPPIPTDVEATDGEYTDRVEIRWQGVVGAEEYELFRSEPGEDHEEAERIGRIDAEERAEYIFDDDNAEPGDQPEAPEIEEVDNRPNYVRLEFGEPSVPDGSVYRYTVVATNENGRSGHSEEAMGRRAAKSIDGYEVRADDGDWEQVSDPEDRAHEDGEHAGAPAIEEIGAVSASQGEHADYVELTLDENELVISDGQTVEYQVRATTESAAGKPSEEVAGRRKAGDPMFRWEASDEGPDGVFEALNELSDRSNYEDAEAPVDGEPRWYRMVVAVEGAEQMTSDVVKGYLDAPRGGLQVEIEGLPQELAGQVVVLDSDEEVVAELTGSTTLTDLEPGEYLLEPEDVEDNGRIYTADELQIVVDDELETVVVDYEVVSAELNIQIDGLDEYAVDVVIEVVGLESSEIWEVDSVETRDLDPGAYELSPMDVEVDGKVYVPVEDTYHVDLESGEEISIFIEYELDNPGPAITEIIADPAELEPLGSSGLAVDVEHPAGLDIIAYNWEIVGGDFVEKWDLDAADQFATLTAAYTPHAQVEVEVVVVDEMGDSDDDSVWVQVGENEEPVIEDMVADPDVVEPGEEAVVLVDAYDPHGGELTYSWYIGSGEWMLDEATGSETTAKVVAPDEHDQWTEVFVSVEDPADGVTDGVVIVQTAPGPSAQHSSITAESGVVADGVDEAEISVEIRDENDDPIAGVVPEFTASGEGNDDEECTETNDNGIADCWMTSTVSGVKYIELTEPVSLDPIAIEFVDCDDDGEPFGGGDGSSGNPYRLCSPDQLNEIGADDSYWSDFFVVTNDIDMEGIDYNVIGHGDHIINDRFEGGFDGEGHTIENLTLHEPDESYVGLFGIVDENTVVENVTLENVDVHGDAAVGGLVGRHYGTITNSYASGEVDGRRSVGALVGNNRDGGNISGSQASANVTGDEQFVGGLVGENRGGSTISDSHASGEVNGGSWDTGGLVGGNNGSSISTSRASGNVTGNEHVGGLVGDNFSDSDIEDSYATGDVTGDEHVGGLVGLNREFSDASPTIDTSYATGKVVGNRDVGGFAGENDDANGAEINNSYWDEDTSETSLGIGSGSGDVTARSSEDSDFTDKSKFNFDFAEVWTIDTAPDGFERPTLQLQFVSGCNPTGTPFGGGDGSQNDPYLLCTPDHLNEIGADDTYWDDHFLVSGDIDLADLEEPYSVIGHGDDFHEDRFRGTFDGDGHTIANLTIDRPEQRYIGLFGIVDEGARVENTVLVDVDLEGDHNVGGLVARNKGSVINSRVSGEVTGASWVGGLVGRNSNSVVESAATATVVGDRNYLGGLVGYNYDGVIIDSYATGDVTNLDSHTTGGLVGYDTDGVIRSSFATGDVVADSNNAGGLAGAIREDTVVENCYATGDVTGNNRVGGLVGEAEEWDDVGPTVTKCYSTGTVTSNGTTLGGLIAENDGETEYSYWDIDTSEITSSDGGSPLETREFDNEDHFQNWKFDDVWVMGLDAAGDKRPLLQWSRSCEQDSDCENGVCDDGLCRVVSSIDVPRIVEAGSSHFLGRNSDGTMVGWGLDNDDQSTIPEDLGAVVDIAAGYSNTVVAKEDGTVKAWGNEDNGQNEVPDGLNDVIEVATAGGTFRSHTLALKEDGTIVGWGSDDYGQSSVPEGLDDAVAIDVGSSHSLALREDGTVEAWGNDGHDQTAVPEDLSDVTDITAGTAHNLALKSDGTVVAWGRNWDGESDVPDGLSNVVEVAAGGRQSLALKDDGTVVVWGGEQEGENIVPASIEDEEIETIAAYDRQNLAMNSDGDIFAWGRTALLGEPLEQLELLASGNHFNLAKLEDGRIVGWGRDSFQQAEPPADLTDVEGLAAGGSFGMARRKDGTVEVWGRDVEDLQDPPEGLNDVIEIDAGNNHALALESDGTVEAWGENGHEQADVPEGFDDVQQIAAGGFHNLVLRGDGTVEAWGRDDHGQSSVPEGLDDVIAIAAGGYHSVVLEADGTVHAWGVDDNGVNTVPGDLSSDIVDVATGWWASYAITSDGDVEGWGSPGWVPESAEPVDTVDGGVYFGSAISAEGHAELWGSDNYGQVTTHISLH